MTEPSLCVGCKLVEFSPVWDYEREEEADLNLVCLRFMHS